MRVVIPGASPLAFERPLRVLRARTPAEALAALDEAQAALDSGRFVAGYLCYELGAALAEIPIPQSGNHRLLALGIYEAPSGPPPFERKPYRISTLRERVSQDDYEGALAAIARSIYDGDVYQVNYTVPFDFVFDGDAASLFYDIADRARVGYAALVEDGAHALLSFSPELFLKIEGAAVRTKPMKGTAALDRIGELDTPKNLAEHVMIVDLLRNDLQRICSSVRVRNLYEIERYPTLATMTSTIEGMLHPGSTLRHIFSAAFPCGSITGAPKRSAMRLIGQLETSVRGAYTGSIGYAAPDGSAQWNVAIRTLQIDRVANMGRLDAGGGIVADSAAEAEWAEIALKRAFVEPFVRPFALLETLAGDAPPDRIERHAERLRAAAQAFGIPLDLAELKQILDERAHATVLRIRLHFDGTLAACAEPLDHPAELARLRLSAERVRSDHPMLRYKTSWRDIYNRGLREAAAAHCFDTIYRNERGELTEGARTNLFLEIGGELFTPPVAAGLLPGILRAELIAQGRCRERVLYETDLETAGAVFAGNSARGLLRAQLVKDET